MNLQSPASWHREDRLSSAHFLFVSQLLDRLVELVILYMLAQIILPV